MKTTAFQDRPNRRHASAQGAQRGQSMVEYAVICGLLAVALFAPVLGEDKAVGQLLTDAIRTFYANLTNFVSLP